VLGSAFLDLVLSSLIGQAGDDGSACDIVHKQVHASLLAIEGD
jgi:hypothetical protein